MNPARFFSELKRRNDLQDLLEQHGAVDEVHLMMDRMTGKSRGFGFATMNDGVQGNAGMSNRPRTKSHEAKAKNLIKE